MGAKELVHKVFSRFYQEVSEPEFLGALTALLPVDKKKLQEDGENCLCPLVYSAPVPLLITSGVEGRILYSNHAFANLVSLPHEEISDQDFWIEKIFPDTPYRYKVREEWESRIKISLRDNSSIEPFETEAVLPNGEWKVLKIFSSSAEGYSVIILVDYTNGRKVRRLRLNRDQIFREAFAASEDAVLIVDGEEIVDCNDATLKMLQMDSRENILGTFPWDWSPEKQKDGSSSREKAREMMQIAREKKFHRFEWTQKRFNGDFFPSEITLMCVPFENREMIHVTWKDISEQKENEKKLSEAKEEALEANRERSLLLAKVSHELRTPLNAIIGFSELMMFDEALSEHQKKVLEIVYRSGDHLLDMVNEILDFSKLEADREQLFVQNNDLMQLINEIADMFLYRATSKKLDFFVELSSDLVRYLHFDLKKVRQVLINLISNAVKYTQRGSIELFVETFPEGESELLMLHISVRDTGPGISKKMQEKIFSPFFQGEESTFQEGTGLGLTIARRLIEMMNGELTLESSENNGSVFSLRVPVQKGNEVEPDKTEKEKVKADFADVSVLVVDDNQDNLDLLRVHLKSAGFKSMFFALNGVEAVELFEKHTPKVVFLDLLMPVMDGYEALEKIRLLPGGRESLIFAATALVAEEEIQKMEEADFDDILVKPYKKNTFFDLLWNYQDRLQEEN